MTGGDCKVSACSATRAASGAALRVVAVAPVIGLACVPGESSADEIYPTSALAGATSAQCPVII